MPIKLEITGGEGLEKMGDDFVRSRQSLRESFFRTSKKFGTDAEQRIKSSYLSGPRPDHLGVVSGRLRSSINNAVAQEGDDIEIGLGTNVKYGPRWEFGFSGSESVKAHSRFIKKAFGKSLKTPVVVSVRSFTRNVDVRAKPFLAPAINDEMPGFTDRIQNILLNLPGETSGE